MPNSSQHPSRVCRVQGCSLHKLFDSVLLWGWQEELEGMGHLVKCTTSQYQWSSCWDTWRYSDCHQFQHLCSSDIPEGCLNLTLLLSIFGVAGHCQANSACDYVVFKPCAKIITGLQWRQVIYSSWKPGPVLQLVHSIAKIFRPSCNISSHIWSNFLSQQQELADS